MCTLLAYASQVCEIVDKFRCEGLLGDMLAYPGGSLTSYLLFRRHPVHKSSNYNSSPALPQVTRHKVKTTLYAPLNASCAIIRFVNLCPGSVYDKDHPENCWPHYLEDLMQKQGREMPGSSQEVLARAHIVDTFSYVINSISKILARNG